MAKSVSITVFPSATGAEYLSVADAMRQVLDLVEALDRSDMQSEGGAQIVWRLTEAHTNSPPFTVTAEAFPADPTVSVALAAQRVLAAFSGGMKELLAAGATGWLDVDVAVPLKRVLLRNLNGIGRTRIVADTEEPLDIVPSNAQRAVGAIEHLAAAMTEAVVDHRRTELGSAEIEITGITRWNERPALAGIERLSRAKVTCVLSANLAATVGAEHRWQEAWDGRRLLVGGSLHYGPDGNLKRVDADIIDDLPYGDVSLSDLTGIDLLDGRTVAEHIELIRGQDLG